MKGYQEAERIDAELNKLLAANPITEANAREWLAFARTVQTSCEVLLRLAAPVALRAAYGGEDI